MKPILFEPPKSPFLVPFDGTFRVDKAKTEPPKRGRKLGKAEAKAALQKEIDRLEPLQRKLVADRRYTVLIVLQALDAAGKDGTIRALTTGLNAAGFQVSNFKRPSDEELAHDFLWRVQRALPEKGLIGLFNRSHYEEVLIVRVRPQHLAAQRLARVDPKTFWEERYESIRDAEKHWARSGTVVLKFWLNVSRHEQKRRLLDRIDDDDSNWKFEPGDLATRADWDDYMKAYESALNATSTPYAPWYAVPADDKPFARLTVAKIIRQTLDQLDLRFPELSPDEKARLAEFRASLERD